MNLSFGNLAVVVALAFVVRLVLGAFPRITLPGAVPEIVLGVVVGPQVLGWVHVGPALQVLSALGLSFLLFLAGLELDLVTVGRALLRLAAVNLIASAVLAGVVAVLLAVLDVVDAPLLMGIVLLATSLGIVLPTVADAGLAGTTPGRLVIAAASLAEAAPIVLLSFFFSTTDGSALSRLVLFGLFALALLVGGLALRRGARSANVGTLLRRLEDSSAQIRVRGAVLVLVVFVWLAEDLGLESILGAFLAGTVIRAVDSGAVLTDERSLLKLDGLAFGFLVPVFFVTSGVELNLKALLGSASALALIPLFVACLLLVRAVPAVLYRRHVGGRSAAAAGLLQASTLSLPVVVAQLGVQLGELRPSTAAALVAAALVSVMVFPVLALRLLRDVPVPPAPQQPGGWEGLPTIESLG